MDNNFLQKWRVRFQFFLFLITLRSKRSNHGLMEHRRGVIQHVWSPCVKQRQGKGRRRGRTPMWIAIRRSASLRAARGRAAEHRRHNRQYYSVQKYDILVMNLNNIGRAGQTDLQSAAWARWVHMGSPGSCCCMQAARPTGHSPTWPLPRTQDGSSIWLLSDWSSGKLFYFLCYKYQF